jgi:hypothetical protein
MVGVSSTEQPQGEIDNVADAIGAVVQTFGIGAAISAPVVPPVAMALGVAAGVGGLIQLARNRLGRRASEVAVGALERLGDAERRSVAHRITHEEDAAVLCVHAVDASLLSQHREQAVALGHVLGDALGDRIAIDDGAIVIEALRTLDLAHFVALRALAAGYQGDTLQVTSDAISLTRAEREQSWSERISEALPEADESIVQAIGAALNRAGAVSLDPPGFRGYAITLFGWRLLDYIGE